MTNITKMIQIRVESGQEVMSTIERQLTDLNITNGAIVSVIGAVDGCCISNMPKSDAKKDTLNQYNEPFELSGNGEVLNGKPHIHCIVSREGEEALAGHLHWAKVENWYVHIYVIPQSKND